ncbi:MAG: hypothetical protein PWQ15_431 [Methanobacterium sp.]|jgi:DNA-directed RNA polymerase subunit M|uniref:hypothetical protein n=1 Tax=Methanobacterium sp. TaxID=2164 RepID=UPI0003C9585E|nr:hypothetical protein [Methanobacterium sp.]MDI3549329.1 hypothetical protein [Methanobacterium sp.]CDG65486.1 hypothetical protein MBMB1_1388 [Methanobacterium sp. MB1]
MTRSKFCPNCGSRNIKWINPQMWSIWHCGDCGYQGAVVIEDKELADAVRKNFRKIRDEENESGSSYDDE